MKLLYNLWHLSRVTIPFIGLFLKYRLLQKGRGSWHRYWLQACNEVTAITKAPQVLQQRMRHYLFANSITSLWFSVLRGQSLSKKEELAGHWLGLATPVADYLVDIEQFSYDVIQSLIELKSEHPLTELVHGLFKKCRELHHDSALFDAFLEDTQRAQDASAAQRTAAIDIEKELQIMSNKGGYALLLYRSALEHPISPAEHTAVLRLGAFIQLHNDIFDVFRDQAEGIATLATRGLPIALLRTHYQQMIAEVLDSIKPLHFPQVNKYRFILLFSLIAETGYIALDQYELLQAPGEPFDPTNHTRQDLVCDMDDFAKIRRVIWATLTMQTLSVPCNPK